MRGSLGPCEPSNPSANWEHWIYAESCKRYAPSLCPSTRVEILLSNPTQALSSMVPHRLRCVYESCCSFLLPCPKSVWEASAQSTWESEYEASRLQASGLVSLGDLIDLQRASYTSRNAQKLDRWNAGVDTLGSLLNLVGDMV